MTETYLDRLVMALRVRDVPGDRIGQVVAEVEAHVAESGDSPLDAFGPVDEYAQSIASTVHADRKGAPKRSPRVPLATIAVAAGSFLTASILSLLVGRSGGDIGLGWMVVAAAGVPIAMFMVHLHTATAGQRSQRRLLTLIAFASLLLLAGVLLLDRVLVPWYVALPAGLVLLGAGIAALPRDRVIDPRHGGTYRNSTRILLPVALMVASPILLLIFLALIR